MRADYKAQRHMLTVSVVKHRQLRLKWKSRFWLPFAALRQDLAVVGLRYSAAGCLYRNTPLVS